MEEMIQHDVWGVLQDILLILGLSGLIIPFLQYIKISPVLGYLLCGLLLGPYSLGLFVDDLPFLSVLVITDMDMIHILAELGVVFLLFTIGLELTFSRLWDLRRLVLGMGSTQIFITGLVIFGIALQFDNSMATAILVGAAFALSSTATIMQLLTDWHLISRPLGRTCFSVLLMQDLAVVPILVLVSAFSGDTHDPIVILLLKSLFMASVVIALIAIAGKFMLRPLLKMLSPSRNSEWLFAMVLFVVMGAATLTHSFGLSAALGAFLAGLFMAETEYRHEIEVIIDPVKGILMGIFFLSVGMSTDIAAIMDHAFWLPVSVIGIFLIKAALFYPVARMFRTPKNQAAQASVMLAQCGEFAFIVLGLAVAGGLMPQADAQFFLLVATVSLLITPLTTKLAPLAGRLMAGKTQEQNYDDLDTMSQHGGHIIIAGFGRVGQTMAYILEDQKVPYIAIDKNGEAVSQLKDAGYPVVVGNARHKTIWQKLNIADAKAVILTIDDHEITDHIIQMLRADHPDLPIVARIKDTIQLDKFYKSGATTVVPETLESTLHLMRLLLEQTGIEESEAHNIINKHRKDIMAGPPSETAS